MRRALAPGAARPLPGEPIVPGVLILARVESLLRNRGQRLAGMREARDVKFHRIVRPGERLWVRFESPSPGQVRFSVSSETALVAGGLFVFDLG